MKKFVLGSILLFLSLAGSFASGDDKERPLQLPQLSADFTRQCNLVLPSPTELTYRKIGWRTSVLHGVVDAQKSDKPVMIVLMNGHPLGCT